MLNRIDERTKQIQKDTTQAILASHVEPTEDIKAERLRATFNVTELAYLLNGGKENLEKRQKFAEAVSKTTWGDKSRRYFLSREEEYVGALRAALGIWEKMKNEGLDFQDGAMIRTLVDFPGGLELHIGMFIPSLLSQADKEQQAEWLPKCYKLQIIGTYAQTELAHGTFVRGLETTATYDPHTQEFIMHSPTLTSTKWWPGGMGKTSTHAVVMARLFVKGKDHGPHAFIVQLRDVATHLPMPGITVGDIGPKFGYGGVDNGFMSMDHVRIPRRNMLMRFAKVTEDGTYVPPPPANAKASYATMLFVRADIVRNAGGVMARAVTIATRYAAVRRQTASAPGGRELQILDYQNVADLLLPMVGAAYANTFMGESLFAMYEQFERDRDRGDFSALPELHALSSGLKAVCTWITANGIEECRRTCGGHGYSRLSGLPTLFQNYIQNVTWEGDNNVLCLQTARYLLKSLLAVSQGKPVQGSAAYLNQVASCRGTKCTVQGPACWSRPAVQVSALQHVATRLAVHASEALRHASGGSSMVFEGPAWNSNTVVMIRLAKAHCNVVLVQTFINTLAAHEASKKLQGSTVAVLGQLCSLFALTTMESVLGDFLEDGYMTGSQAAALREQRANLLLALRPNAVALVDAFAIEDYTLHSALGRHDGDVYRALLEMAQGSPLNATQEGPAWESVLKPMMAVRSRM